LDLAFILPLHGAGGHTAYRADAQNTTFAKSDPQKLCFYLFYSGKNIPAQAKSRQPKLFLENYTDARFTIIHKDNIDEFVL
jgi:hypothetical protein